MKRNLEIKRLYDQGLGFQEIGNLFGISRQRVHQIIVRFNKLDENREQPVDERNHDDVVRVK